MNPELQQQTDLLVKAIQHLETTMHQDFLLVVMLVGVGMLVLGLIGIGTKGKH